MATVSIDTKAKMLRAIHLYLDNALIATKDSKSGRPVFVLHPMFARDIGDLEAKLLKAVVDAAESDAPAPKSIDTFEALDVVMKDTLLGRTMGF